MFVLPLYVTTTQASTVSQQARAVGLGQVGGNVGGANVNHIHLYAW